MLILIDRAQMRVLAKNASKALLTDEATEATAWVLCNEDGPEDFKVFTDYELRVLYRSLGAVTNIGTLNRLNLINGVMKLLHYLPATALPRQQDGLYDEPAASTGTTGNDRPRARASVPAASGGIRGTIWSVADAMWEAAGKPVGKPDVLALRKKMMGVLEEEHGVKRTSSSNELGNWQKARIQLD